MNIHSFVAHANPHAHVDDKREAILSAALELFAERGFHGTAVPEIAVQAGVGAGTIYRHFESKEAIVNTIYQRWKGSLGASLMDDFPYDAPARAQLDHFIGRLFAFAKKHPSVLKFLEAHHHAPYLDQPSRDIEARLLEPVRGFFDQHIKARIIRKVPAEVLFGIVWGGVMGIVRASWEGYVELDDKIVAHAKDSLWDAIRRVD